MVISPSCSVTCNGSNRNNHSRQNLPTRVSPVRLASLKSSVSAEYVKYGLPKMTAHKHSGMCHFCLQREGGGVIISFKKKTG